MYLLTLSLCGMAAAYIIEALSRQWRPIQSKRQAIRQDMSIGEGEDGILGLYVVFGVRDIRYS